MELPLDRMPWFEKAHEEGEIGLAENELYANWCSADSKLGGLEKGFEYRYILQPNGDTLEMDFTLWPRSVWLVEQNYHPPLQTVGNVINRLTEKSRRIFADYLAMRTMQSMHRAWQLTAWQLSTNEDKPSRLERDVDVIRKFMRALSDLNDKIELERVPTTTINIERGLHYAEQIHDQIRQWETSLHNIYISTVTGSVKMD